MIIFITTCWLFKPPASAAVLMVLPLIIDGAVQKKTTYESTNIRRLLTGLLFGYAICWLIIMFLMSGFHLGMRIGNALKK